jgi:hypothetical protein
MLSSPIPNPSMQNFLWDSSSHLQEAQRLFANKKIICINDSRKKDNHHQGHIFLCRGMSVISFIVTQLFHLVNYPVHCWKQYRFVQDFQKKIKTLDHFSKSICDDQYMELEPFVKLLEYLKVLSKIYEVVTQHAPFFLTPSPQSSQKIASMIALSEQKIEQFRSAIKEESISLDPQFITTAEEEESVKIKEEHVTIEEEPVKIEEEPAKSEGFVSHSLLNCEKSFLRPNDRAYNLMRLGQIHVLNASSSICTEEIYRAAPRRNYIHLGYENHTDLQTKLGDDAIAGVITVGLLSVIAISFSKWIGCVADSTQDINIACPRCYTQVENWWQSPIPKTLIAGSGLLLAAAVYLHRKGLLGEWLHDSSRRWRFASLNELYKDIARELTLQVRKANEEKDVNKSLEIRKIREHIQQNLNLIETHLVADLQIDTYEAKDVVDNLRWACEEEIEI